MCFNDVRWWRACTVPLVNVDLQFTSSEMKVLARAMEGSTALTHLILYGKLRARVCVWHGST